ncbi:phosphonate metabolism protein PhnM [Bacillaceae bacterium Marseille-Q3522]|nr:phosphonate metabolism protein PhnM [Bacillaceae bacterium Marseille-Q3522]
MDITIIHGNIVMKDRVIKNGTIEIQDGKIIGISENQPEYLGEVAIDAKGSWVMPGIIDSHSDAIELEVEPRPGSYFPVELSFYELEKKLVGEGITTIYHAVSIMEGKAKKYMRQQDVALSLIEKIKALSVNEHLIRHKTHMRLEITSTGAVERVIQFIKEGKIDQLSFMDHTPGQGQFKDYEVHKKYLMGHRHYSEEEVKETMNKKDFLQKIDEATLQALANLAAEKNIPVASHDDDSVEKVEMVKSWHALISEFPVAIEAARKAKALGMYVVMGAPNVLLGKSHSNNISALDAVADGVVDILCSDYYPSSLLHAVFKLYHSGMPIYDAVKMVSLNPAIALKLDQVTGSIEVGKEADLLIVREENRRPVIERVLVGGRSVCQLDYRPPMVRSK